MIWPNQLLKCKLLRKCTLQFHTFSRQKFPVYMIVIEEQLFGKVLRIIDIKQLEIRKLFWKKWKWKYRTKQQYMEELYWFSAAFGWLVQFGSISKSLWKMHSSFGMYESEKDARGLQTSLQRFKVFFWYKFRLWKT